jgi:heme-degrading monooxygenase HmoA
MPVIVVTRLRLRDPGLLTEFFTAGAAVLQQAKKADGNLGADALGDANNVFWTHTAWQGRDRMQAFMNSEPRLTTMGHLDDWCDEATFAE